VIEGKGSVSFEGGVGGGVGEGGEGGGNGKRKKECPTDLPIVTKGVRGLCMIGTGKRKRPDDREKTQRKHLLRST